MEPFRLLVVAVLIAIVASLGSALFHLGSGRGDGAKMARALTWRIGLSVSLFLLLLFAWSQDWIQPHGIGG